MAYEPAEYELDGVETDYDVTFPYINPDHVKASVNGAEVTFTWLTPSRIQLDDAGTAGQTLRVYRDTDIADPVVTFQPTQTPFSSSLNLANKQLLYKQQEEESAYADAAQFAEDAEDSAVAAAASAAISEDAADIAIAEHVALADPHTQYAQSTEVREKLTANRDFYVNHNTGSTAVGADGAGGTTTYQPGNDANSGLSPSLPKATLTSALTAARALDLAGQYRVRIFVARNSNITERLDVYFPLHGQADDQDFQIIGDETNPENCHFQNADPPVNFHGAARLKFSGFKTSCSGLDHGVKIYLFANVYVGRWRAGAGGGYQIQVAGNAMLTRTADWEREGNAAGWLVSEVIGNVQLGTFDTETIGSVTYSDAIIDCGENSSIGLHGATWSGTTPNGQKYRNWNSSGLLPRADIANLPGTIEGVDNVACNQFDLHNGSSSTNRTRITTAATQAREIEVQDADGTLALISDLPVAVNFSARRTAGADQTGIANNTFTKLVLQTEDWDIGSAYGVVDSRWTPPAGKYHIGGAAFFTAGLTINTQTMLVLYKNGSAFRYLDIQWPAVSGTAFLEGSVDIDANGTDYYELWVYGSTGSSITVGGADAGTRFFGHVL